MSKKIFIIVAAVLVLSAFAFWGQRALNFTGWDGGFIPPLRITGDVEACLTLRSVTQAADTWETKRIKHNNQEIDGLKLQDLISTAGLMTGSNKIFVVGRNGFVAEIDADTLAEVYLMFSASYGWSVSSHRHPRSVNVKDIKEIIVVSSENCWSYGFNVIRADKNILNITPGQAYFRTATLYPHFEGRSAMIHDGQVYETGVFTLKRVFELCDLCDLLEVNYNNRNLIMGATGGYGLLEEGGLFVLKGNHINYISADRKHEIEKVRGVLLDAPAGSIMDHYSDVLRYILDYNERVLTILIDGFGYHQYLYAIENGYAPFLASLPKAEMVTALYRPITNVGLAAIITGKPPEYSGVYGRHRDLRIPSLFGVLQDRGKETVFIGGGIRILNKEIEPVLNVDHNKSGTVDDEIFASALAHFNRGYDFMMVHFHNVDDAGEIYGDLHAETMQAIKTMDGYLAELVANWSGRVIIIADHGMHSLPDGGGHGCFRFEDLLVPYLVVEGGAHYE
ncbi:alkaline phosphatase family protein [Dehalococcoidia bacterium]|nr:alkaline phosphatase family protein [Dehalococcoidia bacterium]